MVGEELLSGVWCKIPKLKSILARQKSFCAHLGEDTAVAAMPGGVAHLNLLLNRCLDLVTFFCSTPLRVT